MNTLNTKVACNTVCTFSFGEKLFSRVTFYGGIAIGAYGISLFNPFLGMAYMSYAVVSYILLMRYTVCARCPHLFEAGDCLFAPAPLVKELVSKRSGPLKMWEYFIMVAAVFGVAIGPVYWLVSTPVLLAIYSALTVGCILGLVMRICKKCQVRVCPLNRNPVRD